MKALSERCQDLHKFYSNANGDKMTRVIYWLTVVTTLAIPWQLVTGLYGMNFSNMPYVVTSACRHSRSASLTLVVLLVVFLQ